MPDPYPDGKTTRSSPAPQRGHVDPSRRQRRPPLFPFVLAAALVLIVALAAGRGDDDAPTLVASDAEPTASTAGAGSDAGSREAGATDAADDAGTDAGVAADPAQEAEVLGTAVTPGPAPEPTPTVRVEDLPVSGSGEFVAAPAMSEPIGAAPYRRFAVVVETGIGVDVRDLATFVDTVLADDRSWIGDGATGFHRVATDQPVDFTLVVATPDTVDRLCAPLQTAGQYSCGANGWIALNLHRWMTATPEWPASLEVYRRYLVNHEVGHYILGGNHDSCPEPGALAPIMMQQTIDLDGCRPNGWVYPRRS